MSGYPNVRVLNVDALAGKYTMNPEVLDNVRAGLAVGENRVLKLVANLPFNIATPVLGNLLLGEELAPDLCVVTIQHELAERLVSEPATGAYGSLSVLIQSVGDIELIRTLSSKVFWPRPKVSSAVVKITRNLQKCSKIPDLAWFSDVVRRVFIHRRKNLRSALYNLWKDQWTKTEVDNLLGGLGLLGEVRAEAMNVEEFLVLTEALRERFGVRPQASADPA